MITIYNKNESDLTTLGLGTINASECTVSENAGGAFDLQMTVPCEEDMKYTWLENGRILKVDCPVRETPIAQQTKGNVTRKIYKVDTGASGVRLYLRSAPDQNSKGIHAYRPNTEVAMLDDSDRNWMKVAVLDGGNVGYMWKGNLVFVRNETENVSGDNPSVIIKPTQYRKQFFRIYKVEKDSKTNSIKVDARHIFYDLVGNVIKGKYEFENKAANVVLNEILALCTNYNPFNFYCYSTENITGEFENIGLVEALLDPEKGIVKLSNSRIVRDNFDVYIIPDVVRDRGVSIRAGKNLTGVRFTVDDSNVVTRIIPMGSDKKGETVYIDGNGYVDSPLINNYATVHAKAINYGVSVGDEFKNVEAVKAEITRLANEDFANGCDLESISLDVDFVMLGDTEEYSDFEKLQSIHLYDTVHVYYGRIGVSADIRMNGYDYDAIAKRYSDVRLGDITDINDTVYSYNISDSAISTQKIARGAVNTNSIANGAITALKIPAATIEVAHIGQAAIDSLTAESITAVRATIRELVAGHITTDQLYADLAEIATAQITTANIKNANIDWAQIQQLSAQIAVLVQADIKTAKIDIAQIENLEANIAEIVTAKIGDAKITTAQIINLDTEIADITSAKIGTAKIDFAKVYDLTADTAIITEGVSGQLFISRLAVTDANMVSLTTGELMLKAADGSFVRLIADGQGGVTTQTVQVEGSNIANSTISGGKIIENSITARELNVTSIFADNALIRAIKAANIDVANLFAADATIAALDAYLIRTNTIEALKGQLSIWADDKIELAVGNIHIGGENLLHGTSNTSEAVSRWKSNGSHTDLTSFEYGDDYPDKRLRITDTNPNTTDRFGISITATKLIAGNEYTFSANVINFGNMIRLSANSMSGAYETWNNSIRRMSYTFTATGETHDLYVGCLWAGGSAPKSFDVWKLKLESGNKATDWSENTTELSSRITQTAGAIALKADASTVTALGTKVTTAEQNIDAVKGEITSKVSREEFNELGERVSTAESEITQTPDKISAAVKGISIGGANLLKGTRRTIDVLKKETAGASFFEYGDPYPDTKVLVTDSTDSECVVYVETGFLTVGQEYTFSADVTDYGHDIRLRVNNTYSQWGRWNNSTKRVSVTFTAESVGHWLRIICRRAEGAEKIEFSVRKVKLEEGNMATAWRESDEEFRAGSEIEMTKDKVQISTPEFAIDLPGDNDLHMDVMGATMSNLTVTQYLDAPNLAMKSEGGEADIGSGNVYTTLSQAARYLNNTNLTGVVKLTLTSDIYDEATFSGLGGTGQLEIYGNGKTIYGSLTLMQCQRVYLYGVKIVLPSTSANVYALAAHSVNYLYIDKSGSTTSVYKGKSKASGTRAIQLRQGTKAYVTNTELYTAAALIEVQWGCVFAGENLKGGDSTDFLYTRLGVVMMRGTRPAGVLENQSSLMFPSDPSTLTVASGSAPSPAPSTTTLTLGQTSSRTNYGSTSWQTAQGILYQGMYGSDAYRAVYWFDRTGFSGKTIKNAMLTLTRKAGSGTGGAVNIWLWGTPLASADGNPRTNAVDYGVIGTLNSGETKMMPVPLTAAQALAAGTIKGFMLDPADTAITSRGYSANYTKMDAAATLTITY